MATTVSDHRVKLSFRDMTTALYFKVLDLLPQSAPAEPTEEVKTLIAETKISQADIARIHRLYQRLRHQEGNHWLQNQMTLSTASIIKIVPEYRTQVISLLRNILQLGGCYEQIDWSHFLYIFIKFCSLSKVEVCQLLFLIIVRECRGLDVHYLTSAQLDRFYDRYRGEFVPVGMNCNKVHFSNFPLSRYYVTDFIEICFLYGPLVNSILFLQRKFQQVFPSLRFWDEYDFISGTNRKITLDFFLVKKHHLIMNSSVAFQETCDMLLMSSDLMHKKPAAVNPDDVEGGDGKQGWKGRGSLGSTLERSLEIDFLSKNRKFNINSEHGINQVYAKMQPNSLLKRKDSRDTA